MKLFTDRSLTFKMNVLFYLLLISFSVVMFLFVKSDVEHSVKSASIEKARSDLSLTTAWIDSKYPGEWKAKDGILYKGDLSLNDQTELVDQIGSMTNGDTVTFFLQDTRVSTNVKKNGERVLGTKIDAEIGKKVLAAGETYYGEANVVGSLYQAAYMPLKDKQGQIVGIYYIGAPTSILEQAIQYTVKSFTIVLLIFMVLAIALLYAFMSGISRRLHKVTYALGQAAQGTFVEPIHDPSKDEIGRLSAGYNAMREHMQSLIHGAQTIAAAVASSSEQLTASAEQNSQATDQIAASVSEVASDTETQLQQSDSISQRMDVIAQNVGRIQEQIGTAQTASGESGNSTGQGMENVRRTIEQMNQIQETSALSTQLSEMLRNKTGEITNVIGIIHEIAEQTNLLALNASIEAARAGANGGGFTVVASEIRKLSTQTKDSIGTVSGLLRDIQASTRELVAAMNDNQTAVARGMEITQAAGRSFETILLHADDISNQLNRIHETSNDIRSQADHALADISGAGDITREVASLSQNVAAAAQEQTASMQEIASSAAALAEHAGELLETVSIFSFKR